MIFALAWKEYREQRSIWLTMVVMTAVLGYGLAQLVGPGEGPPSSYQAVILTILGLAATYGLVCGSMMFAGERENGTLVYLDIFLGRRELLWLCKFLIGILLVLSESLAVAGLLVYVLKQTPPGWLQMLVGKEGRPGFTVGIFGQAADPKIWFLVLPAVTLEAYAWGLLSSSLTQRVLSGAALAAVIAAPLWLITIFSPPPVFLGFRLAAAGVVLLISNAVFLSRARESSLSPPPKREEPNPLRERLEQWEASPKFELERRAPALAWSGQPKADIPVTVVAPAKPEWVRRPKRRLPQARSAGQVLWWLTWRQAQVLVLILAGLAFLTGLLLPSRGQVVWPLATLLLGVACGTAAFAPEQRELSYQFLATQHLPLRKIWNFRILFWLTAAVLLGLALAGGGGLVVLAKSAAAAQSNLGRPDELPRFQGFPAPRPPVAPAPAAFDWGTLPQLMGPVLFISIWLVYGFAAGQVLVWLCRKAVLAVLLAVLASGVAIALWLPSLLCGGMSGWQVWLTPVAMLIATRLLVRAWAGGRIKERKPLAALAGACLIALAWLGINLAYRAWELPLVEEPLDPAAFRASLPGPTENRTGQKILEAVDEAERFQAVGGVGVGPLPADGPWLRRVAEVARLPLGVIERPQSGGQAPLLRHLPTCQRITAKLRELTTQKLAENQPRAAFEHLAQILALSRNLRNKAPVASYLAGVEMEASALEGLDRWLAQRRPSAGLLRHVLAELDRHAAETPPAQDCLQTECFRAGGVLANPPSWSFYSGPPGQGVIRERWLAGWIAYSLDTYWEEERSIRLWRLVWAGLFRALRTPYWQLPEAAEELKAGKDSTCRLLRGWLPAAEEPESSLTATDLARLLDISWLSDDRLITPVVRLRAAATWARWRVAAGRLEVALALYQLREGKSAATLSDLVPNYLPKLPVDPYSGQPFHYRLSTGEVLDIPNANVFQGREGPSKGTVRSGQGVLWSTGPDRVDNGGRRHGGNLEDDRASWHGQGYDLITVVPYWPAK